VRSADARDRGESFNFEAIILDRDKALELRRMSPIHVVLYDESRIKWENG
jgi:hypothetical protein